MSLSRKRLPFHPKFDLDFLGGRGAAVTAVCEVRSVFTFQL